MVQRTQVLLIDDLDGTEADQTVRFTLDGVSYEIDLTDKHAKQLRDKLATWITAARRVPTTGRTRGGRAPAPASRAHRRDDLDAIRQWGRDNGWTVSDRGRIAAPLQDAYDAAHA